MSYGRQRRYHLARALPVCITTLGKFLAGCPKQSIRAAVTLAFFQLFGTAGWSGTHYVSNTGSNTFPYDTWQKSTDSMLLAINAASVGDTVRVAAGSYTCDSLPMKRDLTLVGAGRDSTYVQHNGNNYDLLILADGCLVEGLHFDGIVDTSSSGILTYRLGSGATGGVDLDATIRNNRFTNMACGVQVLFADQIVSPKRTSIVANEFARFEVAIRHWSSSSDIRDNVLLVTNESIGAPMDHSGGYEAHVTGNVIIRSVRFAGPLIDLYGVYDVIVRNNICVSRADSKASSIWINRLFDGFASTGVIENNLSVGSEYGILVSPGSDLRIKNNIIIGSHFADLAYDEAVTTSGNVGFNLFWRNDNLGPPVDTAARIAYGSLFALPMFVDSIDYHLQAYSPAIDAGDTLLLDPDGTRSDMGPYGGPLGAMYSYVDLPPSSPSGVSATSSDSIISLVWLGGHEADFDHTEVYRDTIPILSPDPSLLVGSAVDTAFVDMSVVAGNTYHYRVRCVDAQGNASILSEPVFIAVTGVHDEGDLPRVFELLPSSPNPFNSGTKLRFSISGTRSDSAIRVRLTVFDILGRRIATLVDARLPVGEHQVFWSGMDANGHPMPSGLYLVSLESGAMRRQGKLLLVR